MAEWFVFVDAAYYPYPANKHEKGDDGVYRYLPVVADTPEQALEAAEVSPPSTDEYVFVVPWDQVTVFAGPQTVFPT